MEWPKNNCIGDCSREKICVRILNLDMSKAVEQLLKTIVASCELWPCLTDGFAVAVVDNSSTTVGLLSRELSRLLWHFLTHGGEMNANAAK